MTRAIIDAHTLSAYAKARNIQASPAVRVGELIFVSGFPRFKIIYKVFCILGEIGG